MPLGESCAEVAYRSWQVATWFGTCLARGQHF